MHDKLLRSQRGFTLIELMIVVGIIGILAAIAAPNFSRYQSKARQSEAKIALAAIYSAEKSFFSEYSAYVGSMANIGYQPEGQKQFYGVGFATASGTTAVNGFTPAGGLTLDPNWPRRNFPPTWSQCGVNVQGDARANLPANWQTLPGDNPNEFTAGASGQIREGQNCDQWTINHNKILANTAIAL